MPSKAVSAPKVAASSPPQILPPIVGLVVASPPKAAVTSPPKVAVASPPKAVIASSAKAAVVSPPKAVVASPPKAAVVFPPKTMVASPPKAVFTNPAKTASPVVPPSPNPTKVTAHPQTEPTFINKVTSPPMPKLNRSDSKIDEKNLKKPEPTKEAPTKNEKLSLPTVENEKPVENGGSPAASEQEESNGVGDKIKIFEKAAEEANKVSISRSGSTRRPRTERLPSDELPPPPPTIVRPEVRPLASPADLTIRSPSLGVSVPDRFPSHGTAFRNVTPITSVPSSYTEDEDTPSAFKSCKTKPKERERERYSVSRGSSYFTRGSEEIWLVKKKDIEEIEERVLESFRRGAATLGRGGRRQYARSESLDPGGATRAHTLRRQTSVACTCNHDKRTRARSADTPPRTTTPDEAVDKYETLV